jgi:hypothetical protein
MLAAGDAVSCPSIELAVSAVVPEYVQDLNALLEGSSMVD